MVNIFSCNYLARKPIERATKTFAINFSKGQKILDIGCGHKPYKKYFSCEYIGLDPVKETNPDIIANAWEIPCQDDEFDGIILNQALEHIEKTQETISEIKRILKPGGLCMVTVPHTMKNHSLPIPSQNIDIDNFDKSKIRFFNIDYYRFTKFGLIVLFKEFNIVKLEETSGYFGTIFQLLNYFFTSISPIKNIFFPIYFINNILGLSIDKFFYCFSKTNLEHIRKFFEMVYLSLPLNYIIIIKNNDEK